jgi:hypothetical protein
MGEHSLYPQSEVEAKVLLERIHKLRGHVMSVGEWRSMISAVRQLIPRKQKLVIDPSELNLASFSATFAGRIVSAMLIAFSSRETFSSNKRYSVQSWMSLGRDFYSLALYLSPPPTLEFAGQILVAAREANDDTFMSALAIIGRNEPMLVRQVASKVDLDRWQQALVKRMGESCSTGEEYEGLAGEGELAQDDYDSWFAEAEEVVDLSREFLPAFNYPLPAEFARLKDLMETVERPPDRDSRDYDSDDRMRSSNIEAEYWTIDRMFEDL